jgi:hypothetical protein
VNREQFQQGLKAIAVQHAREIIAEREEGRAKAQAAKALFEALRDAPTWMIAQTPKPKGFVQPSEIWSQPVVVNKDDDDS